MLTPGAPWLKLPNPLISAQAILNIWRWNLDGHGGLGDIQEFGRPGKAAMGGHGVEDEKLVEIHPAAGGQQVRLRQWVLGCGRPGHGGLPGRRQVF